MIVSKLQETLTADVADILARDLPWSTLSGARFLVSGAGGFLGGYLTRTLLGLHALGKVDEPLRVVAMVRNEARAKQHLADLIHYPNLALMSWDLNTIGVPEIGGLRICVSHSQSCQSAHFR